MSEVLKKVQSGDFPSPKQLKPVVPAPLDAICKKAMSLNLENRYGSPADMAADVEAWLADEPVSAYEDPWLVRISRLARRHKTILTSIFFTLAITVVLLATRNAVLKQEHEKAQELLREIARLSRALERAESQTEKIKISAEIHQVIVTDAPYMLGD